MVLSGFYHDYKSLHALLVLLIEVLWGTCRHMPLPTADAKSKHQQEAAIEQLLQELDIDLLVLAR